MALYQTVSVVPPVVIEASGIGQSQTKEVLEEASWRTAWTPERSLSESTRTEPGSSLC